MGHILNFEDYTVALIAVLQIEAEAALGMLDNQHDGRFENVRGDDYIYIGGDINGHNVVIATSPEGQNYGVGSAAALVNHVKARFSNIWFALSVGVAAGLPNLSPKPPAKYRDIRLGDVIVCVPEKESVGIVHYDLGKDTEEGFLLNGRQTEAPAIVRAAIRNIKLTKKKPFRSGNVFSRYLTAFQEKDKDNKFLCPSQEEDEFFEYVIEGNKLVPKLVKRDIRNELERTRVWYGNIGSGNSMMRNSQRRDELRDKHDLIGLEMEAAGIMNTLPTGVIRGVCDYGDAQKNKDWQPYAAAVAAVYAKGVLYSISPKVSQALKGTPITFWLVPFQRNERFVGRDYQLDELSAKLSSQGYCKRVAVTGLGGVGKTQIVLEFAHRTQEKYPNCSIFWVPASNPANFEQAYLQIGQLLKIPGIKEEKANVKQLVRTRLSQEAMGPWLLIVDNADDIDVLYKRADDEIPLIDYLPVSSKGSIIFTTRNRKAAVKLVGNNIIEVDEMNQADAKEVLEKSLLQTHLLDDHGAVVELLELLTYLPLAITQAAAYMNENDISISSYVALYNRGEEEIIDLLSEDFEDQGRYRDTQNPIATTWLISFDQIRRQDQLAVEYLSFMSCLVPENIPKSLLPLAQSPNKAVKAIGTLTAYSFVVKRELDHSFDMHRLVHLATRNWLRKEDSLSLWTSKALVRLIDVFPSSDHKERDMWIAYLPHAHQVLASSDVLGEEMAKGALLNKVGCCLQLNGQYEPAGKMHRQALELTEKALGVEHPDTLMSMNNLAEALNGQGRYEEAGQMHQQVLRLREKVLGIEHPSTLTSMNNLAWALTSQGRYAEAGQMHQQALGLMEKVLGIEHPSTLTSMNNLAGALNSQGRYAEAERMYRQAIGLMEKVLGAGHPSMLMSMNNLAGALNSQGRYEEAEQMHQQVRLIEKVLGIEHPDTLMSMNNLAEALSGQGRYEEAEQMHQQVLRLREKVLGIEHPSTLTSMNNLAGALSSQGRYAEAEQMYRQVLRLREKVLGIKHPSTLTSVYCLAYLLHSRRQYEEASTLYERASTGYQKSLGPDHPTTLACMKHSSSMLEEMRLE